MARPIDEESPFRGEPPDWMGGTQRATMSGEDWHAVVIQQGMEWGLRPEQIELYLAGRTHLSQAEATGLLGQLEHRFGPGYSAARAQATGIQAGPHRLASGEEIPYSFLNRGQYRSMTEAGREMYRSGVPISEAFEQVKRTHGEGYDNKLRPGLFWRQNQARAGQISQLAATSFWATGPNGERYTSSAEDKVEKRKALEIGHQMVRIGDRPVLQGSASRTRRTDW